VFFREGLHFGEKGVDLMRSGAHEADVFGEDGLERLLADADALVAGEQWNEGDVSCSVVRRVALPDACFAADGLFETFLSVLDDFGAYPAVIDAELERYLPFLATTKILVAAVKAGVGREQAHEAIKEHAVAVALEMRERGTTRNDLLDRLAADARLGLDRAALGRLLDEPLAFAGNAAGQVDAVVAEIGKVVARHPEAATYTPSPIL
jgi:adenylosuccinate lyase